MEQKSPLNTAPGELYGDHLRELQTSIAENLSNHEFDAVVFASGQPVPHHRDDNAPAFRGNADFMRVVGGLDAERDEKTAAVGARLGYTAGHFVVLDLESEKPTLFVNSDPKSPWYMPPAISEGAGQHFNLNVGTPNEIRSALRAFLDGKKVAGVGRKSDFQGVSGIKNDPVDFLKVLDRNSLAKTPFEIAALRLANVNTARGHEAALDSFMNGGTQGEVLMAFSAGAKQREAYQSYPPIVGIGKHAAVLHHEGGDFDFNLGDHLLLDAGMTHLGYPADVTSTFLRHDANPVFREVVKGLDIIQRDIVKMLTVDSNFNEMQRAMHIRIGELLIQVGILRNCSAEEAAVAGYTKVFCPHSIGHSLGARVHDRGMLELGKNGKPIMMTDKNQPDSILNGTVVRRPFVENQVMTVEPGIYFIKGLLDKHRSDAEHFDWKLIDMLEGGARIETNVWVTRQALSGNVDLTRLALPKGTNA